MEPVLLKSLKLLRNTQESLTGKDIAEKIEEDQVYVAKALGKLTEKKVITKNGEFYRYQKTLVNEEFSKRILAVYDKVSQKQICEPVTVGLLSTATQYKYLLSQKTLLRVMEEEGFDSKDINNFLEEEIKAGRIEKLKVTIISKKEGLSPVPPVLSFYHISHLRMGLDEYERLKKRGLDESFHIQEEDYLIANFPLEIAKPAKRYLEEEMSHVQQKIRKEAFEWWYKLRN